MKRVVIYLFIVFTMLVFTSCKENTVWVYYNETGSNDPWGDSETEESAKIKNIEAYLANKHIKTLEIYVVKNDFGPNVGETVITLVYRPFGNTGTRIYCRIREQDVRKAKKEKFTTYKDDTYHEFTTY